MEKIRKVNYVNEVYDQLSAMISGGELAEGMKIPSENVLGRELNVSRSVVREALQRLRAERRIITYQGLGSFCANPMNYELDQGEEELDMTPEEFQEFLGFRAALEYGAIMQAVVHRTPEDLAAIETHLNAMLRGPQGEAYTKEDEAFHYGVYLATHNSMIIDAYTAVRPRVYRALLYLNLHKGAKGISGTFHQQLFECIRDGSSERAIKLMKAHDEYNRVRVAEYWKLGSHQNA